ncbi:MAG: DUF1646 family protein [Candidatus Omnitrophica bacterium]|nr:DUF1646 family protein [Candidatus Omnitrophota bacterium]
MDLGPGLSLLQIKSAEWAKVGVSLDLALLVIYFMALAVGL